VAPRDGECVGVVVAIASVGLGGVVHPAISPSAMSIKDDQAAQGSPPTVGTVGVAREFNGRTLSVRERPRAAGILGACPQPR
jgi:hypothetical protein